MKKRILRLENETETMPEKGQLKKMTLKNKDGWPMLYACRFIEPGLVNYKEFGTVLVRKDVLDKMAPSFVGKPVVNLEHKDVVPDKFEEQADGIVTRVWFENDGWYWCEFMVWDEATKKNCEGSAYSVSCAYDVLKTNPEKGTHNNIPYEQEILDGVYSHMAIVANPRYEDARIVVLMNDKGGTMFKFWKSKKEKDERKNASEVDPEKATVDVDGERVPLKILVDTWKAEEAEIAKKAELARQEAEANTVKEDTVVEIDGKEIAVKSMMDSHRRRKASEAENAKLKAENEAKAKAEAEAEAEAAKKKAAADNENDATCEGCKNRCHSAEMVKHNGKSLCAECAKKARAENEAEAEAAKKAKAENDLKAEAEAKKKAENEAEEKRKNFEALQKAANDRNGITPPPALTTRKELAEEGAKRYGSAKK